MGLTIYFTFLISINSGKNSVLLFEQKYNVMAQLLTEVSTFISLNSFICEVNSYMGLCLNAERFSWGTLSLWGVPLTGIASKCNNEQRH